jgi:cysteine-S-conjugate beta-lyase
MKMQPLNRFLNNMYNFDEIIDRTNTFCEKWDGREEYFGSSDVLPLWVADMDFRTPDFITNAIIERAKHSVLGYNTIPVSFYQSICNWMRRRHQWQVEPEWLLFSPGIVPALHLAVQAFSQPGEKVIIQSPVYFPFYAAIRNNERELVTNPLVLHNGRYYMDYDDLEKKIDSKTRMLILCNPHNPGGMAWTKEELLKLSEICIKNNLVIVSDEIHSDLLFEGYKHTPLATVSDEAASHSVTFMSPSKTFNMAGLYTSEVIIPDAALRKQFKRTMSRVRIGMPNAFGIVALQAAYNQGEPWLGELMQYLNDNLALVVDFFEKKIPQIKVIKPEATYLVWLDCRKLGLNNEALRKFFIEKANVGLNNGPDFGPGGEGFQRLNLACPRAILHEALLRIEQAVTLL